MTVRMFKIENYLHLVDEFEHLLMNGYQASDIAILYRLPLSTVVDEIMRFSDESRLDRRASLKKGVFEQISKINRLSKEELIFMYNDVVVRKINPIECMKKFDIPYSLLKRVEKRLIDLKIDKKKNFLKKSKYYNEDSQIETFIRLDKLDDSLAQHYKTYYLEKFGFTQEFVETCHDLQLKYSLSCEELAYKFNVDYLRLRSILFLFYQRISYPMIEKDLCLDLVTRQVSDSEILDILESLKNAEIFDIDAALMLNVRLRLWTKIKRDLLSRYNIDQRQYEVEKKRNWTHKNLAYRYGDDITNVAQVEAVKQKTLDTINSERVSMTRRLSLDDSHPVYYRFSTYSEDDLKRELFDLIINRGYRAEDIVRISDIQNVKDVVTFNQANNEITQLATGDYTVRIESQIEKFKTATIDQLKELNDRLSKATISNISDICSHLYLPFRAFNSRIRLKNVEHVSVDGDILVFPVNLCQSKLSSYESAVSSFLNELDVNYEIQNRKILEGFELDFYLPDHKIGIEINPSYTHNSNKYFVKDQQRDISKTKSYHFEKYVMSKDRDVTLIQLYEWDFKNKSLTTLSANRLASILKPARNVDSRNCEIKEISVSTAKAFLNQFDSRRYANSTYKYGMFCEDELIAVATFSKSKSTQSKLGYDFELKRLAFKSDVGVIRATSKFVSRFFEDHTDVDSLHAYSDNDWDSGTSYEKAGFKFVHETGPSLRFVSRNNYAHEDFYSGQITTSVTSPNSVVGHDRLQKGLSLKLNYNVDKYVETELSHRIGSGKGYDRVYTSGSKKWEIHRNNLF